MTFQAHIENGRALVVRLERYPEDISESPPEDLMATSEISAWFDAAERMIAAEFGQDSEEIRRWRNLQKEIVEEDRPQRLAGKLSESRAYINRINRSIGLLTELQHYSDSGWGLSWTAGYPWEKWAVCVGGVIFLAILLWKGLGQTAIPDRQWTILRTILATAGAACAAALPGFITVKVRTKKLDIRAAGALAVFGVIFVGSKVL